MLGSASPPRTVATLPQKAGDDSLSCAMSLVGRLNAAAATALPREVSGVKNPVPSPREDKTKRPASSTTVAVIGVPSSLAFSVAALTALSAISSVSSAMPLSTPFRERYCFNQSSYQYWKSNRIVKRNKLSGIITDRPSNHPRQC